MYKQIIIAVISAVLLPVVVTYSLPSLIPALQIAGGIQLTSDAWLTLDGGQNFILLLAVVGFIVSLLSVQLSKSGGAGSRGTGTTIEQDVEDGRERGVVKWFNVKKGFGFITWDEGEDVFVHFRSIRGQGHRSLNEGQRVKFTVVDGDKGPQAEDVSIVR